MFKKFEGCKQGSKIKQFFKPSIFGDTWVKKNKKNKGVMWLNSQVYQLFSSCKYNQH